MKTLLQVLPINFLKSKHKDQYIVQMIIFCNFKADSNLEILQLFHINTIIQEIII